MARRVYSFTNTDYGYRIHSSGDGYSTLSNFDPRNFISRLNMDYSIVEHFMKHLPAGTPKSEKILYSALGDKSRVDNMPQEVIDYLTDQYTGNY